MGDQGMFSVCWPGMLNVITPPQTQFRQEVSFSAGKFDVGTVGAPATHGAGVFGTQGMGVRTPAAAVVADDVAGKASELQTPKGGMFTIGLWSMMFPASMKPDFIILGVAMKEDGAAPNVHFIVALVTTCLGKIRSMFFGDQWRHRSPFARTPLVFSTGEFSWVARHGDRACV